MAGTSVIFTAPGHGHVPGDTADMVEAEHLVTRGLARYAAGTHNYSVTGPTPDNDPMLASNREAPGEEYDFDPAGANDEPAVPGALSPATGAAAGGTVVTLTGTNLEGSTSVTFAGTGGTSFSVNGPGTAITVTTPAHAAGAVNVVVNNPRGNVTKSGGFTYS